MNDADNLHHHVCLGCGDLMTSQDPLGDYCNDCEPESEGEPE